MVLKGLAGQLLSSLAVELDAMLEVKVILLLVDDDSSVVTLRVSSEDVCWLGSGSKVHTHSLRRFRRPATGVSGQESLSDSDDESRFSPVRGECPFSLVRFSLCANR